MKTKVFFFTRLLGLPFFLLPFVFATMSYCLFFCPPGYVHLCVAVISPSAKYGLFFPPEGMRIDYEGALSRRIHAHT